SARADDTTITTTRIREWRSTVRRSIGARLRLTRRTGLHPVFEDLDLVRIRRSGWSRRHRRRRALHALEREDGARLLRIGERRRDQILIREELRRRRIRVASDAAIFEDRLHITRQARSESCARGTLGLRRTTIDDGWIARLFGNAPVT